MKILLIGNYSFQVDDIDFEILSMIKWRISNQRGYVYAEHSTLGKLHRFILGVTDSKIVVDHIDRNTLNCQRSNLRTCTIRENILNSKVHSDSKTGYKGVFYDKKSNNFKAIITNKGRRIIVSGFNTKYDAMLKYNELAKKYFGEFAGLNVPTFEDQFKCYLRGETNICPIKQ